MFTPKNIQIALEEIFDLCDPDEMVGMLENYGEEFDDINPELLAQAFQRNADMVYAYRVLSSAGDGLDYPDEMIHQKQAELNDAYDAFTAKHGLINNRANGQAFADDSSYYLLCSLENVDEDGNLQSKADMFTKRTIKPERRVTSVDTPSEALAISIGERGHVDLPFMADLLGTPGEYDAIKTELRGVIFKDPMAPDEETAGWQTADEYLSGDVRSKLRVAQMAANSDSSFAVNVAALEKAQPKDLDASEIDVRLGATWVDPNYIQQFMQETFETPYYLRRSIEVKFSEMTAEWRINGKSSPSYNDVAAYVTYGTDRANAYRILEETLNLKDIRIYDTIEDPDGTHIDKAHIHNHIIYNSTAIDATRKFDNFFLSGLAVQKLSDRVCAEHGLSIITPKPYRERAKRTEYPKRKPQREELREAIDAVLSEKPKTFEDFIQSLSVMGIEFQDGKHKAFRMKGGKSFLRLRSLGEGYSEEEIRAVISGKSLYKSRGNTRQAQPKQFNLLIDIEAKMAEGKTVGYEKWAKKYNRKEAARTVCLLKEKGVGSYEELAALTDKLSSRFSELSDSIKAAEKRMAEIGVLQTHINNYSKTRKTYEAYRKSGYSKKFFEEHREELMLHKAAKQAFDQLEGKKVPTRQALHEKFNQLLVQKKKDYAEYRQVKKDMQEYLIAKQTVETILNIDKKKEQEKKPVR